MAVKIRRRLTAREQFISFLDEVCNPRNCSYWRECGGKDPQYCELWEDFRQKDRRPTLTLMERNILLRWEQGENTRVLGKEFQCSERTIQRYIKKALQILTRDIEVTGQN